MKKNIFIKGLGALLIAGGISSCSSDYLSTKPETDIPTEDVTTDVNSMKSATLGLIGTMYRQYSGLYDYRWFNGEPWISMYYGEVPGSDYICYFWINSHRSVVNWESMSDFNTWATDIGWAYCYGIVGMANTLIAGTDNEDAMKDASMQFYRAQCLTMRAHAYTRLLQIYGPRWADSNNGQKLCLPLRVTPADTNTDAPCPLSSMGAVLDQIYADLDEAISLYQSCGVSRTTYQEPDLDVARGLYARAALLKNDYQTAQKMAHDARQGYPLMSNEEYLSGFADANGEWMWASQDSPAGIYYASFGATYACNGAYPTLWGSIGAGAIDIKLYNQMDRRDIRRQLYFTPDKGGMFAGKADFWNSANIVSGSLSVNKGVLTRPLQDFCTKMYNQIGAAQGWNLPYSNPSTGTVNGIVAQFGAQFKFWGKDNYSSSMFPYMRGAEMMLIEAEAAYCNGDEGTALAIINQINGTRVEKYKESTASGEELLDLIKFTRRVELWGEGFCWFDLKRWGDPLVREAWVEGDTDSGNWDAAMAFEYTPESHNGWRVVIPNTELRYNKAINLTDLDYATE